MIFSLMAGATNALAAGENICLLGEPATKGDPLNKNFFATLQVFDLQDGKGTVRGDVYYDLDQQGHQRVAIIGIAEKVTDLKTYAGLLFSTSAVGNLQNTFVLDGTNAALRVASQSLSFRIPTDMTTGSASISVFYQSGSTTTSKDVSYNVSTVACRKLTKTELQNNQLFNLQMRRLGHSNDQTANSCATCHT
jgi:hypothetical protein